MIQNENFLMLKLKARETRENVKVCHEWGRDKGE
jgi:hypothetical protein